MAYVKIYKSKVSNAKITLQNKVHIGDLINDLTNNDLKQKLQQYKQFGSINFWDFGDNASKNIKASNQIFILCGKDIYWGNVIALISDESGEIGDCLRWVRQYGNPWTNVVLINNLSFKLKLSDKTLSDIELYISKLPRDNKLAKQFFSIPNQQELIEIVNKQNIEAEPSTKIIVRRPKASESTISINKQRDDELYYGWISEIDDAINLLKKAGSHHERENESLVEKFFINLGYEQHKEIRFRQGRIDVSVNINDNPMFVIEVKRRWDLSRSDKEVLQQAFGYAQSNGSRFVIISNGDYYAVFDRDKGRSYDTQFAFEFKMTELSIHDLRNIKSLHRSRLIDE